MSGTKSSSRLATVKKDGSFRYATRFLTLEKGKRNNSNKDTNSSKSCDCLLKSDNWKGSKHAQNSKLPAKKSNNKCCPTKDNRKKANTTNHREKVVIVSKRSSSVSVVKSCNLRKSVSVKKVSYSTSVVLSSDEDSDSDEESEEEEKKECSRKRKTVLKHTTSKVKSSIHESKKVENKSAKKAKAIRLLCDKLSGSSKQKGIDSSRELRPRFPYNMLQDWPSARTHRMASLNALAKVHVLYENEGRTVGENLNDADECSLIDFLNENSDDDEDSCNDIEVKKESKPVVNTNSKKNEKVKHNASEKIKNGKKDSKILVKKAKVPRRGKKRKLPDIEIIDTKICKRMASLNAQAILAASYVQEPKPKRIYKKTEKCDSSELNSKGIESKCDISIVKTEIEDEDDVTLLQPPPPKKNDKSEIEILRSSSKEQVNKSVEPSSATKNLSETQKIKNWSIESEVAIVESDTSEETSLGRKCSVENSVVASAAATKVGVTQYTEVRKVQINTRKDSEIKEESKSERKIEQILSNEDVAITQMYHYQSKSTNESYCVQMQTTYKPASKTLSPSVSRSSTDNILPYINDTILPSSQHYYNRNSMLPSQAYQINPNMGPMPPVVGMDHRLPRQYGGSAFTVPHYRHPQPMQFSPNEYGYYQPAGPLIQPVHDQCTIHKPVPYHPQPNPHQPAQRPQQSSSHRDGFQTFETHQSRQHKPAVPSHPSPIQSQQKPAIPASPPNAENLPKPGPSSPQYSRHQPADDGRSRSLNHTNNSTSFTQPPKHVRSPVMPTLYSSQQNFRSYQTQKRVPSTFRSYNQPYERKEDLGPKQGGHDSTSSFNTSYPNVTKGIPQEMHSSHNSGSETHIPHNNSPETHHPRNTSSDTQRPRHTSSETRHPHNTSSETHHPHNTSSDIHLSRNSSSEMHRSHNTNSEMPHSRNSSSEMHRSRNINSEMHLPCNSSSEIHRAGTNSEMHLSRNTNSEMHHPHNTNSLQKKEVPSHTTITRDCFKNHSGSFKERNYGYKRSHDSSINSYNPGTSTSVCNAGTSSSMCQPGTSSNICHPSTSTSMCHPNASSGVYYSGSSPSMRYSNKPSEALSHSGSFSDMYNTDSSFSLHHPNSSSSMLSYPQNPQKDIHHANVQDIGRYPPRPPSVIDITEDNHRDTKTYIQLEVPKNSHREKIVVVDVEDDDIERKHVHTKSSNITKPSFDKPPNKVEKINEVEPEKKCNASIIDNSKQDNDKPRDKVTPPECTIKLEKTEKVTPESRTSTSKDISSVQEKKEKSKTEPPEFVCLDVKKKKESAVVKRAKLNGKQRTFRDCFNRPLAQLSKVKKADDVAALSEKHLAKNFQPLVSLPRLVLPKLEKPPLHGWSWEGTPCDKQVYISNDDPPCIRRCYPSIKHVEGDVICVKDCVFLRSGPRRTDLPFVAKVTALWENPADGEMTMSLLWYYRPEQTETEKKLHRVDDEIFASKHRDTNSVACIEDKCFVLTYSEYCRYRKRCKMMEDGSLPGVSVVPEGAEYPRTNRLPPPMVSPDLVFFCRNVYDYRQKRLLKNPV